MDKDIKKILGSRIREERTKKGWTIERLAEMIELEASSLGLVERADRALSVEKLYCVAEKLGVSAGSLLKSQEELMTSRIEIIESLVQGLSDNEFTFVVDVINTMKNNIKKIK